MARVVYENGRYPFPAGGTVLPGGIVARPDGSFAVYDGVQNAVSGELIQPEPFKPGPIVEIDKASASDAISASTVLYLTSAGLATATSSGNTRCGKCCKASATGATTVLVNTVE